MAEIFLLAVCEQGDSFHGSGQAGQTLAIDHIDEAIARQLLTVHVQHYEKAAHCNRASGFVRLTSDCAEQHLRAGTILVDSNQEKYLPYAEPCINCGWLAQAGSPVYVDGEKIAFYCNNPTCLDAESTQRKEREGERRAQHIAKGLCMHFDHVDYLRVGYCERRATADDHFCDIHRGEICDICGRVATATLWDYENQVNPHHRCDDHIDVWKHL